jgi:hypothetical protein
MSILAIRERPMNQTHDNRFEIADEPQVLNEEERQRLLSESAKLRAAARKKYKTYCRREDCGKEIVGLSRRKFCGQTCQRAHWRKRLSEMGPGDELPAVE